MFQLSIRVLMAIVGFSLVLPAMAGADDGEDLLDLARRSRKTDLELYYSSLSGSEPDPDTAWKIAAQEIEIPYGKVILDGGWFVPLKPEEFEEGDIPDGMVVPDREYIGGVYVGAGRFQYTPPTETERWAMNYHLSQLHPAKKYSDVDMIDVAIKDGLLVVFQGKWRDAWEQGKSEGTIDKKTGDIASRLFKARGDLFIGDLARLNTWDTFGGGIQNNGMTLDILTKDIKGLPAFSYYIDPLDTDREEVQLLVRKRYALNQDVVSNYYLASWFLPEVAEGKTDRELGYARLELPYQVEHYNMDMTVYKDNDVGYWGMQVDGDMELELNEATNVLVFSMMSYGENEFDPTVSPDDEKLSGSNRVIFSEVRDADGEQLQFMHNGHALTVSLPRVYEPGEKLKLGFSYGGLFIMTMKQAQPSTSLTDTRNLGAVVDIINYRLPNDYPWFPQSPSHKDSFTFDWKLKLPKPMIAATSGTLLSMVEEGKHIVHTIKETTPVTFPAILFGRFTIRENDPDYDKGEYKIRIYIHPGFEKEVETFLDEAQGVISFYEAMFGPYPFQELDIAQMPTGIGYAQAPAGLIQMDGFTYISKTDAVNLFGANDRTLDIRDNFVPHEIAHEWWGHKAGWGSSRDQWVSETFAEYSAALYIEERERIKSGDPEDISGYETRKSRWGRDGRLGHTYDRTGPVWVGNRTGARRTSTIYARGPLILDMLRQNFGKESVVKMMFTWCELAERNDGKVVTEDLQLVLEQVIPGVGFDEFIQKYIKGNEPLPDDPKLDKAAKLGTAKY